MRRPLGLDRPARSGARDVGTTPAEPAEAGSLAAALAAADAGDLERALAIAELRLGRDPLDADSYLIHGMAELALERPAEAVSSLRRALYIDPSFGLAAFLLGRALEGSGDEHAAQRAYGQALRTLDPDDGRHAAILDQVDIGDIAAACRTRLVAAR